MSFFKSLGPNDSLKPVTNYISIAPAKERLNDILFIGGQKVSSCCLDIIIDVTLTNCVGGAGLLGAAED